MTEEAEQEKYQEKAVQLKVQGQSNGQNGAGMFVWVFCGRPY